MADGGGEHLLAAGGKGTVGAGQRPPRWPSTRAYLPLACPLRGDIRGLQNAGLAVGGNEDHTVRPAESLAGRGECGDLVDAATGTTGDPPGGTPPLGSPAPARVERATVGTRVDARATDGGQTTSAALSMAARGMAVCLALVKLSGREPLAPPP